ncbi:MAG TPA: hypothetical protein VMS86_07405, partial [Thermoanaerobaculia bacterium]|nr:hypothetical protein [Thermoanaerobaculia bacterium]
QGQEVIVLGQDSLSDGTPVYVLEPGSTAVPSATAAALPAPDAAASARPGVERGAGPGGPGPATLDPAAMTPERLGEIRERMRARGLSEQEIEQRIDATKGRPRSVSE